MQAKPPLSSMSWRSSSKSKPLSPTKTIVFGQERQQLLCRRRLSALTREEEQSHDMPSFIDRRCELRIVAALGESNCLIFRASRGSVPGLMHLEKSAVHGAKLPFRLSGQLSKHTGSEAGIHPTSPTAIDRVPTSPMSGKCTPSKSLPQDMKDRPAVGRRPTERRRLGG